MLRSRVDLRESPGFTLIELLVVIALVGMLTGVVLGGARGGRAHASANRARAELAVIGEMLEAYRREYGDYPQAANTPEKLYDALRGNLGVAQITLRDPAAPGNTANCFVDPWGRAYQYAYYARDLGVAAVERGFVLYSLGVRGEGESLPGILEVVPAISGHLAGAIAQSEKNAPNIYLER